MATQFNIQKAINLLAKEQDSEIRWSFSHNINNQTDLDNILVDLLDNWTSINRGGVSINLKNQTNSSGVLIFPSAIGYAAARTLVSKGWSIGLSGGIPLNQQSKEKTNGNC